MGNNQSVYLTIVAVFVASQLVFAGTAIDKGAGQVVKTPVQEQPKEATWVDPVIEPKVTPIKAVHITQLRKAINDKQTACGMTPTVWTEPIVPKVTQIKKSHLEELRVATQALAAKAGASGNGASPGGQKNYLSFSNPEIVAKKTAIMAVHLNELKVSLDKITCSAAANCGVHPYDGTPILGPATDTPVCETVSFPTVCDASCKKPESICQAGKITERINQIYTPISGGYTKVGGWWTRSTGVNCGSCPVGSSPFNVCVDGTVACAGGGSEPGCRCNTAPFNTALKGDPLVCTPPPSNCPSCLPGYQVVAKRIGCGTAPFASTVTCPASTFGSGGCVADWDYKCVKISAPKCGWGTSGDPCSPALGAQLCEDNTIVNNCSLASQGIKCLCQGGRWRPY